MSKIENSNQKQLLNDCLQDEVKKKFYEKIEQSIDNHPHFTAAIELIVHLELNEFLADVGIARGNLKTKEEYDEYLKNLNEFSRELNERKYDTYE